MSLRHRQEFMYLSMVICIYISVSAIGDFKMSVPFRGDFGLVGRLGSGLGLKPVYRERDCLDGTVASPATVATGTVKS